MKSHYGAWSTSLGSGLSHPLSAFWKDRMSRLTNARKCGRPMTRRDWLRLGAGGIALAVIPTFRFAPAFGQGNAMVVQSRLRNKIVLYAQIKEVPELPGGPETPETRGLFAIDPDSGAYTKLSDIGGLVRVSPDGTKAAFAKYGPPRRDNRQDLLGTWIADLVAKTEPRKLMDPTGCMCWSADSKRLIVSQWGQQPGDPGPTTFTTWLVTADGSDLRKLPIPDSDFVFDWSGDEQWLAVLSHSQAEPGGGAQIFFRRLDGSATRRITECKGLSVNARLSPNCKQLAYYHRDGNQAPGQIVIVDVDGKNSRIVFEEKYLEAPERFGWAPDGKRLVVTTMTWKLHKDGTKYLDTPAQAEIKILVMDVNGKNLRTVPLPTITWLGEPQWL